MPSIIIQQAVTNVDILIEPIVNTYTVLISEMQMPGISAYQVAVNNGFVGTEAEWLISIKGDQGAQGNTPIAEWAGTSLGFDGGAKVDLKGATGATGAQGSGVKITPWSAGAYLLNDQVNHLGKDWYANANTLSTDVPSISTKWVERLIGYKPTGIVVKDNVDAVSGGTVETVISSLNNVTGNENFDRPTNIVNYADTENGEILGTGVNAPNASYWRTIGFVKVEPSTEYTVAVGTKIYRVIFCDKYQRYLSSITNDSFVFTTVANCKFIRFMKFGAFERKFVLCKTADVSDFTSFVDDTTVPNDKLIKNTALYYSYNKFNVSDANAGKLINNYDARWGVTFAEILALADSINVNYWQSGLMPVELGKTYRFYYGTTPALSSVLRITYFDSKKRMIGFKENLTEVVVNAKQIKYISIGRQNAFIIANNIVIESTDAVPTSLVPYDLTIKLDNGEKFIKNTTTEYLTNTKYASLAEQALPLPILPINAVNGQFVNTANGLLKSGIPTNSTGAVSAVYDSSIFKLYNVPNIIQVYGFGNDASWQNYLATKITKQDLINAGADFVADNVFVSLKSMSANGTIMYPTIILRYGTTTLSFTQNTDPTASGTDVRIGNGYTEGIATDDAVTFAGRVYTAQTQNGYIGYKFENLRVPATYKGKAFVGIMILNSNNLQTVSPTYSTQKFFSIACIVATTIDTFNFYSKSISDTGDSNQELKVITDSNTARLVVLEDTVNSGVDLPLDIFYAACGDSITNANHAGIEDILQADIYLPFDGYTQVNTYKRKCYAYFIAKANRLKWANYGWGGTTLTECISEGVSTNGFAVTRYNELKAGVVFDYISLFFGWNDSWFSVNQQREIWLTNTYGGSIFYSGAKIGTAGYNTQAQYDAVQAVTGVVNGVQYNTSLEYFTALMIGTINSIDIKTWYGAWNKVLPALMLKYPLAKILIIVPYNRTNDGPSTMQRDATIAVANKWGLPYYDFRESCKIFETNNNAITGYSGVQAFRHEFLTADTLHPSQAGYEYIYPSMNTKLMSI